MSWSRRDRRRVGRAAGTRAHRGLPVSALWARGRKGVERDIPRLFNSSQQALSSSTTSSRRTETCSQASMRGACFVPLMDVADLARPPLGIFASAAAFRRKRRERRPGIARERVRAVQRCSAASLSALAGGAAARAGLQKGAGDNLRCLGFAPYFYSPAECVRADPKLHTTSLCAHHQSSPPD
jgi:hypothetical protein